MPQRATQREDAGYQRDGRTDSQPIGPSYRNARVNTRCQTSSFLQRLRAKGHSRKRRSKPRLLLVPSPFFLHPKPPPRHRPSSHRNQPHQQRRPARERLERDGRPSSVLRFRHPWEEEVEQEREDGEDGEGEGYGKDRAERMLVSVYGDGGRRAEEWRRETYRAGTRSPERPSQSQGAAQRKSS